MKQHHHPRQIFEKLVDKNAIKLSLVVSTSRPIEIEIENVLSVETNF
jgi:hypothetical protein